jgi:alpha-mannosidase
MIPRHDHAHTTTNTLTLTTMWIKGTGRDVGMTTDQSRFRVRSCDSTASAGFGGGGGGNSVVMAGNVRRNRRAKLMADPGG